MLDIKSTLELVHKILDQNQIPHVLIGGLALGALGVHRATGDVDLMISHVHKNQVKPLLESLGFSIYFETQEVMQFRGTGLVDFLLAQRPLSLKLVNGPHKHHLLGIPVAGPEEIIALKIQAYKNDPKRKLQDQADIQKLIQVQKNMDWNKLKDYAELFDEWEELNRLRSEGNL